MRKNPQKYIGISRRAGKPHTSCFVMNISASAAGRDMPRKPKIGQLLRWSAIACKIGSRSSADINYFSVLHLLYTEFAAHPAPRPADTVKRSECEVELPQ